FGSAPNINSITAAGWATVTFNSSPTKTTLPVSSVEASILWPAASNSVITRPRIRAGSPAGPDSSIAKAVAVAAVRACDWARDVSMSIDSGPDDLLFRLRSASKGDGWRSLLCETGAGVPGLGWLAGLAVAFSAPDWLKTCSNGNSR